MSKNRSIRESIVLVYCLTNFKLRTHVLLRGTQRRQKFDVGGGGGMQVDKLMVKDIAILFPPFIFLGFSSV